MGTESCSVNLHAARQNTGTATVTDAGAAGLVSSEPRNQDPTGVGS